MSHTIKMLLSHKMFKAALQSAEQEIYRAAYEHAGQNQALTARLLGVARGTLIGRLKEWRII